MKRPQFIVAGIGLILVTVLYFFGQTLPPAKKHTASMQEQPVAGAEKPASTHDILQAATAKLTPPQQEYVNRLENAVVRGDVKNQQIKAYHQLAGFWKDSAHAFLPAAYYTGEVAKLENSEKNLTFAARLFLDNLQEQDNQPLKSWMASQAKELFEKALELNSKNDSSKVGLGSCYIFGSTANNPQEVMQGIQQILEVARRDSANMYAQFMLSIGGVVSRQFDKAIERFTKVVQHQPDNLEAVLRLADTNERKGDKANAIIWYEAGKKLTNNQDLIKEIDKRIKSLQ